MEKKSPRILSKLSSKSSSSKSSTLSKDFKNKNNNSNTEDKTTKQTSSNKVSLSFKELKKQQDKQLKLQQQQYKLQQKQLKLQQKKVEKEQKQNTLKSNKNKTTTSNDQTNTNEQPILVDDEKRFSEGLRFKGKLVGIEPVMSARGDKICQDALKNLKLRRTSSHKKRIILNINLNGVQLLDQKTNDLVANHVINLISYITRDISDSRTFGYVYGTPDIGHQFIAIKSEKDSMYVMNAIGELFTYVYNKKKKEKQLEQNQFQDQSITDTSQSSNTIVDNKQPQNQGFDNETLMEFLKQQQDKINNQQSNSSTLPTTTTIQDDFNRSSSSKGFNNFNNEKENSYLSQQSNKFNTLPISTKNTLPPPLPPRLESGQSNYSSNSNLNSFSTYSQSNFDASNNFQSTSNNYQSNLSLATTHNSQYETCSDLQQMQNVISSARQANDKFKNWHQFDEDNNNIHDDFGSNSLISERDDENESIADDNWANFNDSLPEPPPDLPPPLYQSNEDLSITTTSADTYTLTNQQQPQQPDFNNQFSNNDQFSISNQTINKQPQQISNSLNNSQNSTTTAFTVRLDTPPSSNRRRRSTRLSESSSIIVDNLNNNNIKDKQKFDDSSETARKQNIPQHTNNQFETNFNQQCNDEFFDFDKVNNQNENNKKFNLQKTESFLSKESNNSIDLNREDSCSRNDSRISNYNSNQFNNSFDSQFDNQQNDNRIFADHFSQNMQIINSLNNENSSSLFNKERKQSTDNTQQHQQLKLTNKRLSLNELSKRDPNDKYAVFNDINSMKFSIFSNDGTLIEKNDDDQVFLKNNQSLNATDLAINNPQLINNSNNNKLQNFEDSFLSTGNNSLNQSKNSSLYSTSIIKSTQLNQSSNLNTNKESISSNNSIYSSITADPSPELIECHKKFLKERQEKLDQIDKIFEEEKQKIRSRQKELNQEHLKQQKKLLNQQKTFQQEFYQRQKHQRQTILHQLQLQRLPVQQFDQCKLQLQQKLKDDQKNLQQEFIKKQQELKKQQIEEQNQLIKQYKTLEEQYLEKQSELLNSDFEIELDLPEVPNIFDDSQLLDDNLQTDEQALTKKFELSLKNEFDKLNEIVQTTESSLNSSPKFHQERCSTACSIASSNNPFIGDDKFSFEDFDRALNLLDNKIEWKGSGHSSLEYSLTSFGRQYDLDFNMFNNNESKDNSLEYGFANNTNRLNNERLSSASSLDMNRSTSTLPNTFINKTIDNNTLNKSLNNEPFTNKFTTSGIELKKPQFNLNNAFRSQQHLTTNSLSNSLPKNLDNSNSLSNLGTNNNFQSSSNFSSSNYPLNQSSHQKSAFKQPYSLPQNDPFDTLKFDNKLNEINRIKQLRHETQQQLVSLALPSSSTDTISLNRSLNQDSNKNQFTQPNQVKLEPVEEKKSITNTSIKELEDLLGLSTSTLNNKNTTTNNNNKLFDNLFDLKKTNNFTPTTKSNNEQFNQSQPKTISQINLFANDNFKIKNNNSLSFQDLTSDTRTDQFLNNLQKNAAQNLLPLQQKNSLDVFGTVVIDDLNNKSTAKQLFNHFGDKEEPNIFNVKGDPFRDDFFNS